MEPDCLPIRLLRFLFIYLLPWIYPQQEEVDRKSQRHEFPLTNVSNCVSHRARPIGKTGTSAAAPKWWTTWNETPLKIYSTLPFFLVAPEIEESQNTLRRYLVFMQKSIFSHFNTTQFTRIFRSKKLQEYFNIRDGLVCGLCIFLGENYPSDARLFRTVKCYSWQTSVYMVKKNSAIGTLQHL